MGTPASEIRDVIEEPQTPVAALIDPDSDIEDIEDEEESDEA